MLAVKVRKEEAEEARKKLAEKGALDTNFRAVKKGDWVYFPVKEPVDGYEVVEEDLPPARKKPRSLEDALRGILSPEEMKKLVKSFDIIGHVAVIEIPPELKEKERDIAEAILKVHPNVKTVAVEEGPHQGPYRVQPVRVVAGEENLVTRYREHGVDMWLEVGKVYFSVRHSYERLRIARMVKPGEVVAALFAGVGPYPLVIAKIQPRVEKIYAVELNPEAYKWMVYNIKKNHMEDKIVPFLGDVREVVPREFPHQANRIIMPLPKTADSFLDVAMTALKREGGFIHYYAFAPSEDPYREAVEKIEEAAEEAGFRLVNWKGRRVADYAPRVWKVVIDAELRP